MNGKNGMENNPRADGALNAIAAERAILAALLCGDDGGGETPLSRLAAISECALTERDFCDARHLPIFAALRALIYEHGAAGAPVLIKALSDTGELSAAGGARYIADIADIAPATIAEISVCAKEIKRTADLWEAHQTAAALSARLSQPGMNATAADIIAEFSPRLSDIGKNAAGKKRRIKLSEIPPDDDTAPKTESAIRELDAALGGGFRGGMIFAIAGASGSGKTTLAAQISAGAENALIIANDMNLNLFRELIYAQAHGENPHCEFEFLPDARSALDAENIARQWADECDAKGRARRIIILDMAQSLPPGDTDSRADTSERITSLMNCLRRISENTRAAILCLCATRKGKTGDDGGGKNLDDLRDGSDLSYKSDAVLLLIDRDNDRRRELRIAKNRFTGKRTAINLTLGNSRRFAISAGAENETGAANGYAAAADKYGVTF